MLTDALQIELLKNSPTFRRQTSAGVLAVGLERWKAVSATLAILKKAMEAGTLTPEQEVTLTLAQAEQYFLGATLAKQGVQLSGASVATGATAPGEQSQADKEIDRLIDQLFARADWTWTVPDWLEQQSLAQHYINGQILGLLSDLAAAPTLNLG